MCFTGAPDTVASLAEAEEAASAKAAKARVVNSVFISIPLIAIVN